jgi:hypothetical protein
MQFLHELFRQILPGTNQSDKLLGLTIALHKTTPPGAPSEGAFGVILLNQWPQRRPDLRDSMRAMTGTVLHARNAT